MNLGTSENQKEKPLRLSYFASSRILKSCLKQVLFEMGALGVEVTDKMEIPYVCRSQQIDVLVVQWEPEELDIARLKQLLRGFPETEQLPLIVLSPQLEHENRALALGADAFLEFPSQVDQFKECVKNLLHKRKKILLIDDSQVIHDYVRITLKKEPFELFHAYNGREGLELLSAHHPDLVITDIEMPEMNGYEVCAAIKANDAFCRIPVIIASTLNQGFHIDQGFDVGADDYMIKPIDPEELISKLHFTLLNDMKKKRELILVVDDSKVIQSLVTIALEQQGFRCIIGSDGEEGLSLTQELHPALIVTDCEMPKMNGRDMCRELRMIPAYRHLPIIMLTAKDSGIERAKARKAGVNDFITKPFTTEKLLSVAERLLAEAKIVRERDAMAVYMSDAALKHASEIAKGSSSQLMTAYRDEASILFSDVVGFTSLSETMDPESVIELLNGYFDQMVSIIQAHHGTVDKFIGDAIMAIFSGRNPEENAYNAVCAGQAMLASLAKIREAKQDERERIHIRIGINSGSVVFGDLGSKASRRDFTVIGDQVNIAQRLEGKAKPGHVLISQATFRLVESWIDVEDAGEINLKGRSASIHCYLVRNVRPRIAEADSDAPHAISAS